MGEYFTMILHKVPPQARSGTWAILPTPAFLSVKEMDLCVCFLFFFLGVCSGYTDCMNIYRQISIVPRPELKGF